MIPSKWPQKDSGGPSAASPACILKGFCSGSDLFAEFCIQHCPNRCEFGSERATRPPMPRLPGPPGSRAPARAFCSCIRWGSGSHRSARTGSPGGGHRGARSRGEARPAAPAQCAGGNPGYLARPHPRPGLALTARSLCPRLPARAHRCRTAAARTCRTGCYSWRSRPPC